MIHLIFLLTYVPLAHICSFFLAWLWSVLQWSMKSQSLTQRYDLHLGKLVQTHLCPERRILLKKNVYPPYTKDFLPVDIVIRWALLIIKKNNFNFWELPNLIAICNVICTFELKFIGKKKEWFFSGKNILYCSVVVI